MSVFARNAGNVSEIIDAYARHNGVVKPVQEIWARRANNSVEKVWPIGALTGESYSIYGFGNFETSVTAAIFFQTDGLVSADRNGFFTSNEGEWFSPITTNIGDSYFIRYTNASFPTTNYSLTGNISTAYSSLDTVRNLSLEATGQPGTRTFTATIQIATDISGSNAVSYPLSLQAEIVDIA